MPKEIFALFFTIICIFTGCTTTSALQQLGAERQGIQPDGSFIVCDELRPGAELKLQATELQAQAEQGLVRAQPSLIEDMMRTRMVGAIYKEGHDQKLICVKLRAQEIDMY